MPAVSTVAALHDIVSSSAKSCAIRFNRCRRLGVDTADAAVLLLAEFPAHVNRFVVTFVRSLKSRFAAISQSFAFELAAATAKPAAASVGAR